MILGLPGGFGDYRQALHKILNKMENGSKSIAIDVVSTCRQSICLTVFFGMGKSETDCASQLWRSPTTNSWHIDAGERGPSAPSGIPQPRSSKQSNSLAWAEILCNLR